MFNRQIKVSGKDLKETDNAMFCPACRSLMMPKDMSHDFYCPNFDCWLDSVTIWTRKSNSRGHYPISKYELERLVKSKGQNLDFMTIKQQNDLRKTESNIGKVES